MPRGSLRRRTYVEDIGTGSIELEAHTPIRLWRGRGLSLKTLSELDISTSDFKLRLGFETQAGT